jgi:hypothetical protein
MRLFLSASEADTGLDARDPTLCGVVVVQEEAGDDDEGYYGVVLGLHYAVPPFMRPRGPVHPIELKAQDKRADIPMTAKVMVKTKISGWSHFSM